MYVFPILVLAGLTLRIVLRIAYGARGPSGGDLLFSLFNIGGWLLIVLGMVPLIFGGAVSIFGNIVVFLAAAAVVEAVIERRAAQKRSMGTLLALAAEHGQRFDADSLVVEPFARTSVGRSMRRLLDAVREGVPLPAAINRNPTALLPEAVAYVAAGRDVQCEAAALKELSRTNRSELASVWRSSLDRLFYLGIVVLFMVMILTFVMIKIVPEFDKIFWEFQLELPLMTQFAVNVSTYFTTYLAVPMLLVMVLGFLFAAVIALCYLGGVEALRPLGDRVFRGRRAADVLRILAVATEHRQPIRAVFERLAHVYPSRLLRRKLAPAAASVSGGGDWRDALASAKLVTPAEQSLLKSAEAAGNLPWALRTVAARKERRAVYRLAAAVQVIYPFLILILGCVVAFFVVALFIPLIKLIEGLSG